MLTDHSVYRKGRVYEVAREMADYLLVSDKATIAGRKEFVFIPNKAIASSQVMLKGGLDGDR